MDWTAMKTIKRLQRAMSLVAALLAFCACRRDQPEMDPLTEVNKPRPTNIVVEVKP